MNSIKQSIRKRALDSFMDLTGGKTHAELVKTLKQSDVLIKDLKYVVKHVVPCFPPTYDIFKKYFDSYKKIIMDKLEPYLQGDMNDILKEDPEIILVFSNFVEQSQEVLKSMDIQDETFNDLDKVNISINTNI
jgi:hypothetical protein